MFTGSRSPAFVFFTDLCPQDGHRVDITLPFQIGQQLDVLHHGLDIREFFDAPESSLPKIDLSQSLTFS
jgi:hypothetical protein